MFALVIMLRADAQKPSLDTGENNNRFRGSVSTRGWVVQLLARVYWL